ncbi:MAG: hypothetical protein KME57_35395 [Scytonema hyalinum WJT4-NPBG1]|nr:hypothetical protein [Scytonema hyalinum WJT4-NPBG1]
MPEAYPEGKREINACGQESSRLPWTKQETNIKMFELFDLSDLCKFCIAHRFGIHQKVRGAAPYLRYVLERRQGVSPVVKKLNQQ